MTTTSMAEATLTVLRLSARALEAAAAPGAGGPAPKTHPAVLDGRTGTAALAADLPMRGDDPFDVIVVEYPGASGAFTRAWIRHHEVDGTSYYALFAENPSSFPARAYAPAALAPGGDHQRFLTSSAQPTMESISMDRPSTSTRPV